MVARVIGEQSEPPSDKLGGEIFITSPLFPIREKMKKYILYGVCMA